MLANAEDQEGHSDFNCVTFEVIEGHPCRDVQKTFGNSGLKLEDLGIQTWKALAFIDKA